MEYAETSTVGSLRLKFYDQLLQFPLFQGLSRSELLQMAGNTKFGFLKLPAGKDVAHEGDPCTQLHFLVSGQLEVERASDDRSYSISEQLSAPWLLSPESLFGASTRYPYSARTLTETHFITLSKDEVLRLLDDFLIVRLNFLNLYATLSQRRNHLMWRRCPKTLSDRIVRFLLDHCVYPAGPKELHILMTQLAEELNDSRINVSRALNDLQARGLLKLRRGCIEIPSLEHLFM
jgi:CRP-like cAMP-binding protein